MLQNEQSNPPCNAPLIAAAACERAAMVGKPLQPATNVSAAYGKVRDIARRTSRVGLTPERAVALDAYTETDARECLDVALEAQVCAALMYHSGKSQNIALIDYWLAKAGLPFALRVCTTALGPLPGDGSIWMGSRVWAIMGGGCLERLRRYVQGADAQLQAAAYQTAQQIRAVGHGLSNRFVSEIFLEPAWIDADLREHTSVGGDAELSLDALAHAGDLDALIAHLTLCKPASRHTTDSDTLGLLHFARVGDEAIAPLLVWLHAALQERAWPTLERLLRGFVQAGRAPAVFDIAFQMLQILAAAKSQDENRDQAGGSRSAAIEVLKTDPARALPWLQKQRGAWVRLVGVQLSGPTHDQADWASTDALPRGLPEPDGTLRSLAASFGWAADDEVSAAACVTPPRLRSAKALPPNAVQALATLLRGEDAAALAEVRAMCTPESLAIFAGDLFDLWCAGGYASKHKWAFTALGLLGNDESARHLAPRIRAWPGESGHQRAVHGLDVLALIGSDVSLTLLAGMAQKLKFKGLKQRAQLKMTEVAQRRGLTSEALADRLVPDLGLDPTGSKVLDFGPRAFRVGFDEHLKPFVIDTSGTQRRDLPKPAKSDDAGMAEAAVLAWKAMKKDARTTADVQILRLELGMGNNRRWHPDDFRSLLVEHPLLMHVIKRLVWAAFDADNAMMFSFRVADDRTYATQDGDLVELPHNVIVGILHPLLLDAPTRKRWISILADRAITQPFEQLARDTFPLSDAEMAQSSVQRFEGRQVATTKLRGLVRRGWHLGTPQDAGGIHVLCKPIAPQLCAVLHIIDSRLNITYGFDDPTQTLGRVVFGELTHNYDPVRRPRDLSAVSSTVISEVIRDIEAL